MVEQVRDDIRTLQAATAAATRAVAVWCGSTEVFITPAAGARERSRRSRRASRRTTRRSPTRRSTPGRASRRASPSPTARPTSCVDFPAAWELAREHGVAHRRQGLQDRPDADEDDPRARASRRACSACAAGSRRTSSATATARCSTIPRASRRRRSRSSACSSTSSQPELYPELYGNIVHKVRIDYYPPRGDAKEGWDNIDLFGWLGYPMQMKINFLCRDSILAAPIVLDLALFLDLAQRAGFRGTQEWLELLLQEPDDRAGPLPGARSLHPAR